MGVSSSLAKASEAATLCSQANVGTFFKFGSDLTQVLVIWTFSDFHPGGTPKTLDLGQAETESGFGTHMVHGPCVVGGEKSLRWPPGDAALWGIRRFQKLSASYQNGPGFKEELEEIGDARRLM